MPRSSPFPYLSLSQSCKRISILSGMCACGFQSPHPLAAALFEDLVCTAPSLCVAVQELYAVPSVPEAGAQGGTYPSMGPCLKQWVPTHAGSKSLTGPSTERGASPYQAHINSFSVPLLSKGPPKPPCAQEASGSVQLFLVCHCTIFVSSPVSLTLFRLPFLVRAKVSHIQPHTSAHGLGI